MQQKLLIVERAYLLGGPAMRANYTMEAIRAAAGLSSTEPPSQLLLDDQATVGVEEGGDYWGEQYHQTGDYRDLEAGSVAATHRSAGKGGHRSSINGGVVGGGRVAPPVSAGGGSALMASDDGSAEMQPLL